MKIVFNQSYTRGRTIEGWYGKPPKSQYQDDVIMVKIPIGDAIYITPDEASTMIRALSAGLSHYLMNKDRIAKRKPI